MGVMCYPQHKPHRQATPGRCTAIFGSAMNSYATLNDPGAVRFWSLQYGRAYITYAALNVYNRSTSGNQINAEIAKWVAPASDQIRRDPTIVRDEAEKCQVYVGEIFASLENSGFRLDRGSKATLSDVASAMAAAVRRDLGY